MNKDGIMGFNVFANPELRATHGSGSDVFVGMLKRLRQEGGIQGVRGARLQETDSINYAQYRAGVARRANSRASSLRYVDWQT